MTPPMKTQMRVMDPVMVRDQVMDTIGLVLRVPADFDRAVRGELDKEVPGDFAPVVPAHLVRAPRFALAPLEPHQGKILPTALPATNKALSQ